MGRAYERFKEGFIKNASFRPVYMVLAKPNRSFRFFLLENIDF